MDDVIDLETTLSPPQPQYPSTNRRKSFPRKREKVNSTLEGLLSPEEEIKNLEKELEGLFEFYREILGHKVVVDFKHYGTSTKAIVAALIEESEHPLSKLVDEICGKLKKTKIVTADLVKTTVLSIGNRIGYGVTNSDDSYGDILEDSDDSCLWCWETTDTDLIPQSVRDKFLIRRICREYIHKRIMAISEMIASLEKPETEANYSQDLIEARRQLSKTSTKEDIRKYMDKKKANQEERLLIKQPDRNRREAEKQKETLETLAIDKNVKLSQGEAKSDEKSCKQTKPTASDLFSKDKSVSESAILSLNNVPASKSDIMIEDLRKLHFSSWRSLGHSICSNRKQRWGLRQNPKIEVCNKLNLTEAKTAIHVFGVEKDADQMGESSADGNSCSMSADAKKYYRGRKLLQFYNAPRPAFYGFSLDKSHFVGARHPLRKDPNVVYDVSSDEEGHCEKNEEEGSKSVGESEGAKLDTLKTDASLEEADGSCYEVLPTQELQALFGLRRKEQNSKLFPEVIMRILLKLRVKDVQRLMYVHTSWSSFIDERFATIHFYSASSPTTSRLMVIPKTAKAMSFDIDASIESKDAPLSEKLGFLPDTLRRYVRICGSCRGFLFLRCDSYFYLWNPTTTLHKFIPNSATTTAYFEDKTDEFLYGFAFHQSTSDYVVVLGHCDFLADMVNWVVPTEWEIFSLQTNKWTKVIAGSGIDAYAVSFIGSFSADSTGFYFKEAFHWIVIRSETNRRVVIAFDLSNISEIDLPEDFQSDLNGVIDVGLLACNGVLSVWNAKVDTVTFWMMEEHGVLTKSIVVSEDPILNFFPLCFTSQGDIIGKTHHYGGRLIKYNKEGEYVEAWSLGHVVFENYQSIVYSESMFALS